MKTVVKEKTFCLCPLGFSCWYWWNLEKRLLTGEEVSRKDLQIKWNLMRA